MECVEEKPRSKRSENETARLIMPTERNQKMYVRRRTTLTPLLASQETVGLAIWRPLEYPWYRYTRTEIAAIGENEVETK